MLEVKYKKVQNPKKVSISFWLHQIVFFKIILFLIFICGLTFVEAQNEAKVLEASAKTSDLIQFQIFAPKNNIVKGKDVLLDYIIFNQGKKNIYLVIDPLFTDIKVKESLIFEVIEPVVGPDDHHPFNYQFIKIRPQEKYNGKIVLPEKVISSSGLQNLSSATIRVGFSYLFDISNLIDCKNSTYRLPCLNELYDKSKSLTIGNLVVEIKNK